MSDGRRPNVHQRRAERARAEVDTLRAALVQAREALEALACPHNHHECLRRDAALAAIDAALGK